MAIRADELLVKRGLVESRNKARMLIQQQKVVYKDGNWVEKPGKKLAENAELFITEPLQHVSRSGAKLEHYLTQFNLDVTGLHILDVGASTGGFTDCLLQRGAVAATCVDVGHGQLHPKLSEDPRVVNFEGVHARDLAQQPLPLTSYPLVVVDVSFISLQQILAAIWSRVTPAGILIALIKPQFEVTRQTAHRFQGVIKDSSIHQQIIAEITTQVEHLPGATITGIIESPLKGGDGNTEFLIGIKKASLQ